MGEDTDPAVRPGHGLRGHQGDARLDQPARCQLHVGRPGGRLQHRLAGVMALHLEGGAGDLGAVDAEPPGPGTEHAEPRVAARLEPGTEADPRDRAWEGVVPADAHAGDAGVLLAHDDAVAVVVPDQDARLAGLGVGDGPRVGGDGSLAHLDAVHNGQALPDRLAQALRDRDLVRRVDLGRAAAHAHGLDGVAADEGHLALRGQGQGALLARTTIPSVASRRSWARRAGRPARSAAPATGGARRGRPPAPRAGAGGIRARR